MVFTRQFVYLTFFFADIFIELFDGVNGSFSSYIAPQKSWTGTKLVQSMFRGKLRFPSELPLHLKQRGQGPGVDQQNAIFRGSPAGGLGVPHRRLPGVRKVVEGPQGPDVEFRRSGALRKYCFGVERDAAPDGRHRRGNRPTRRLAD